MLLTQLLSGSSGVGTAGHFSGGGGFTRAFSFVQGRSVLGLIVGSAGRIGAGGYPNGGTGGSTCSGGGRSHAFWTTLNEPVAVAGVSDFCLEFNTNLINEIALERLGEKSKKK